MKRKLAISGARGFLGSRIAQSFENAGWDVQRITSEFYPGNSHIKVDWASEESLKAACVGAEAVIHCAGINAATCEQNQNAAFAFNAFGSERFASAAKSSGVRKFIFLSSVRVYDQNQRGVVDETCDKFSNHPYARTKLLAEKLIMDLADKDFQTLSLRISNVLGAPVYPESDCWTLVSNSFAREAAEKKQITIRSRNFQERDFLGARELLGVLDKLIDKNFIGQHSGIFNTTSGVQTSIENLANLIASQFARLGDQSKISWQHTSEFSQAIQPRMTFSNGLLASYGINISADLSKDIAELVSFSLRNFSQETMEY